MANCDHQRPYGSNPFFIALCIAAGLIDVCVILLLGRLRPALPCQLAVLGAVALSIPWATTLCLCPGGGIPTSRSPTRKNCRQSVPRSRRPLQTDGSWSGTSTTSSGKITGELKSSLTDSPSRGASHLPLTPPWCHLSFGRVNLAAEQAAMP